MGVVGPKEIKELEDISSNYPDVAARLLLYVASDYFDGSLAGLRKMTTAYLSPRLEVGSSD